MYNTPVTALLQTSRFSLRLLNVLLPHKHFNYLTANGLLPKFQLAYRMFHSMETALVRVFNDMFMAIDQHCEVILVLLDLSSAFDTIDHDALL